jgi:ribosomal protein L11 methyltransferase
VGWLKLTIRIPDEYQESFIAELLDLDFEGFEQFDDKLEAYITKERFNDVSREQIELLLSYYPFDASVGMEQIEEKNWNESWEKTIQPLSIGPFFVKPTWVDIPVPPGQILLEIDPKMSFGTGYHATTQLMLEELTSLNLNQKTVLDAGTGTGILSIAAVKLGASGVLAFDIDEWSIRNATENAIINKAESAIEFQLGGFEIIPPNKRYDIILANINLNVITGMMSAFANHLSPGGVLCITGILTGDVNQVVHKASEHGFTAESEKRKGEWALLKLMAVSGS